ncbi:MAG: response regulator [Deltaproteobacteria bacterium]|nr:response regulator [Deltaproteobacteria bacterium]
MPKPFEPEPHYALTRRRIIGLGERSVRKNYYPQLQQRLEELKRSELRYRALFENSPISLWEEDFSRLKTHFDHLKKDGVEDFNRYFSDHPEEITRCIRMVRIVDVNRSTLALYEAVSKKELLGSIHRILPQTAQRVLKTELVAMAQAGRFEIECINRTLKGNDRHLLIKSSIPPGYEDSWERVFISVYDLTERIEAEKEKKDLGRQLRQAQKMEAVGTLAGGIAHDFNNILSAVIGFTEMAMEDAPPDTALTYNMEQVLQAGLRAKHLVQQILAFSRQSEHEMKPVQLDRIIKEACALLRASLPTTIDIRMDIQTDAFIMGDPTQMHQVLMNLGTNAGHAMRDRGGRLVVILREATIEELREKGLPRMDAEAYLQLVVQDTGQGIPPTIVDRIFDPFFTTKEHTEGTGMGLSVAHGIIKSHGGLIDVESQVGRGTTFHIYLPKIMPRAKAHHHSALPLPSGSERVLLVDDETMLVDMGRQVLTRLGYQVTACTSSVEALQHFQNDPAAFDLVITDMTMPHLTGKELATALLKIKPALPIILCTGFSETITEETAKRIGIKAFILKPIVMSDLAETMRKVLDSPL